LGSYFLARISPFRESPYFASSLKGSYFAQPLQVARGLAELGCQKCLDEISSHGRSNGRSAHAKDIHSNPHVSSSNQVFPGCAGNCEPPSRSCKPYKSRSLMRSTVTSALG
jgi:hypothetical protein